MLSISCAILLTYVCSSPIQIVTESYEMLVSFWITSCIKFKSITTLLIDSIIFLNNASNASGIFSLVFTFWSNWELYTPYSLKFLVFFSSLKKASRIPTVAPSLWVFISRSFPGLDAEAFSIIFVSASLTILVEPSSSLIVNVLSASLQPTTVAFFLEIQRYHQH